ncbi:alpha-1,4-glucan--maltose-1-phosphate maltosyltransferase [Chloroflexota bacterium]
MRVHNRETRARVTIEAVSPEIDSGRFPVKRVIGEDVVVEADIFADGHDTLSALVLYRKESSAKWIEVSMVHVVNDRWRASFPAIELGHCYYTIMAWVDRFYSWRQDLIKRVNAKEEDVSGNLLIGAQLIKEISLRASSTDKKTINKWLRTLQSSEIEQKSKVDLLLSKNVAELIGKYPEKRFAVTYNHELEVLVEREKARFSTWYEMFPRSAASESTRHGNFKDCESRLPYIAEMGFDVLYLPPIHPIGNTNRKGKNNTIKADSNDPGTPWAIGAKEGGHKSIHPQLGSLKEFQRLIMKAKGYGIEIALDIAFQCSPDHPYVKQHPEWFLRRPDGSIQYAENPPKKYQDIYPLNFETEHWQELWEELKSIIVFWIEHGVRIFRIDNPHTKPFHFWEWLLAEIRNGYPEVVFLAEAFTRPKVMYQLAKLGFTQSYTYFAWRNTKWELMQYFSELSGPEVHDYFRPNLWPNTPDILTEYLQSGGRPAFMARLVLAATLGASYGIYGPAYELCENRPREQGSEEYLDSEKYEIKHWDIDRPDSLKDLIALVNNIRKQNTALQSNANLRFHTVDNDQLICFSKHTDNVSNAIVTIVNLDPYHTHSGWVELDTESLGIDLQQPYQMHDLLSDARYSWQGRRNYVELNPYVCPAHIFRLRPRIRTEKDFDYFM